MRGVTSGHTIEKVYPLSYPKFEKVILLDAYKKRRSKLYYIRDKVGKDAKFKSLLKSQEKDVVIYQKVSKEEKSES
jgi:large subunit ribosomal protein L19